MFDDPKYNSGTSLKKTKKEIKLDYFERLLRTELSDEIYLDLKKLNLATIGTLHKLIVERLDMEDKK